jgi:hypothetical protein
MEEPRSEYLFIYHFFANFNKDLLTIVRSISKNDQI